jgi:pimeloyl-ACP methyl ester carboxylesterase
VKKPTLRVVLRIVGILVLGYVLVIVLTYWRQRSLLYFPSHTTWSGRLAPWVEGTQTIGFCREVQDARRIWLMLHGNAGQAAHREYVLTCLPEEDPLYVLEYPGYGQRAGRPSLESFHQAAVEAYRLLRSQHPHTPIGVLGESIGSGPACELAGETPPPDQIVLLVPFDSLANVAARHFPLLPVRWLLRDKWDNVQALKGYSGPITLYAAVEDRIIPVEHARALAAQTPGAKLFIIPGGHNDWAQEGAVKIER